MLFEFVMRSEAGGKRVGALSIDCSFSGISGRGKDSCFLNSVKRVVFPGC